MVRRLDDMGAGAMRADGTFSVSRTATLDDGAVEALLRVEFEIHARFGQPHSQNLDARQPVFRWRLDRESENVAPSLMGSRIQAAAQQPNKSGTPITVTWDRLADPAAMEVARGQIDEIFDGASRSRPDASPESG